MTLALPLEDYYITDSDRLLAVMSSYPFHVFHVFHAVRLPVIYVVRLE